jgi:diacylglycerol kinase (ATP)
MFIDGVEVNIDEYQNLILLNIDNWGGGVTELWKSDSKSSFSKESFSDGVIEIIGLTDVLHMGQVQVGMEEPFQVGQGKSIKLKSKSTNKIISFQIDGEPI